MAIIVETGQGIPNANSYVSVADVRAYCAQRGVTLPVSDGDVEIKIFLATDYVEARTPRYQGTKVYPAAVLGWPRYPVVIDGVEVGSDIVPLLLKNAVCQLVVDSMTSDLSPSSDGKEVIRERVEGAVDVSYAKQGAGAQPIFFKAEQFLGPLYKTTFVKTIRV